MNSMVESVTNHPKTQKTDCGRKILYGAMARKLDYINKSKFSPAMVWVFEL